MAGRVYRVSVSGCSSHVKNHQPANATRINNQGMKHSVKMDVSPDLSLIFVSCLHRNIQSLCWVNRTLGRCDEAASILVWVGYSITKKDRYRACAHRSPFTVFKPSS